jgi:hypothetical protein
MQGIGEWICAQKGSSLKVIALSSESALTDDGTVPTPEKRTLAQDFVDGSPPGKSQSRLRPKKGRTIHISNERVVYHQALTDVLKHELWLSVTSSFEFNVETLWCYIKAEGSDVASFASKMETRLKSLLFYHADLYRDSRFNEIGSRLISDAKSIQKGFKPTLSQKLLLHFNLIQFGWFLTPVLWNCAELLFLLTTVFDPRLFFVHVVQKDAKLLSEKTQNRGMAACSKFLSSILFERLQEFDLLSTEHQCGDAVVLDSNGSYLQHFEAKRTTNYFKAMLPHTVVNVSNAPAALCCNGRYTKIRDNLYAQNVAYPDADPSNQFKPEPRIIELTNGVWCFKHLLGQGVDCWLMRACVANALVTESSWQRSQFLTKLDSR